MMGERKSPLLALVAADSLGWVVFRDEEGEGRMGLIPANHHQALREDLP